MILTEHQKWEHVRLVRRMAEIHDEYTLKEVPTLSVECIREINPVYTQSACGLFLRFYYGHPFEVWTPWGACRLSSAMSDQLDLEGFMSRLEVETLVEERQESSGVFGPVYTVLAVDGEVAPVAVMKEVHENFLVPGDAVTEWQLLLST